MGTASKDLLRQSGESSAGRIEYLELNPPGKRGPWVNEIKRGLPPSLSKGFHHAWADLVAKRAFTVYSGEESCPITANIEAIGLREMATLLSEFIRIHGPSLNLRSIHPTA